MGFYTDIYVPHRINNNNFEVFYLVQSPGHSFNFFNTLWTNTYKMNDLSGVFYLILISKCKHATELRWWSL